MKRKLWKKIYEKRSYVGVTRAKVAQLRLLRDKIKSEESTLVFCSIQARRRQRAS